MDLNLSDLTLGFDELWWDSEAGVIVGLLWGTVSVLLLYIRSLREGKPPDFDPCLPEDTPYHRWILESHGKKIFWVSLLDSLGWNPSIASLQTGWLDHTWSYLIHLTQAALPIWLSPMTRGRIRNPIQLMLPATWRYSMLDRWPSTLSGLASMILEEVEVCFWFYSSLKYLNCPNLIKIVTILLLVL